MKKIIKLLAVSLVLATVMLSSTSCGLLTAGIFESLANDSADDALSTEEQFYYLVSDTKELLDKVSGDVNGNWYGAIYNGDFDGNMDKAIESAFNENEKNITNIKSNNEQIIELYREIRDSGSYILYDAQSVIISYNAYYASTLEVSNKTYEFYSSTTQSTSLDFSIALKNYYVEL